jgi:hypothetical protein
MTNLQERAWDALVALDSETLLRLVTDYHGTQALLKDGFLDFLVDEGVIESPDAEEEDEEPKGSGDYDYAISDYGQLGSGVWRCMGS